MANTYFAVFGQETNVASEAVERKAGKEGKTLEPVKRAKFIKLEAESVADAQNALYALYGGEITTTPVVVTEAAWKTS